MAAVVRMWEARCAEGRLDDVVAWLRGTVAPDARAAGALGVEAAISRLPDERAVLTTRWATPSAWQEPAAPEGLVVRAHAWVFTPVGV